MKGFIVYLDYVEDSGECKVRLFGRLENGQSFVSVHDFKPYFFIREKELKKIKKAIGKFKFSEEKTELGDFNEERVVKLSFEVQSELNKCRHEIHQKEIDTFEADLKPQTRFVIDHSFLGSINLEGDYGCSEKIDRVYKNPEIKPADFKPKLKVVSIDIESGKAGELYCLGMYSENYKKNFFVGKKELKHTISCRDEEDCLEKFKKEFLELDPDIVTGWNVIDFDFDFLKTLFSKHKIAFDLGRTEESLHIKIESDFFRSSSVKIPGRLVLDGLNFVKDPYIKEAPTMKKKRFDSFSLEDVSQGMVGRGKLIKGKNRHEKIDEYYEKNPQKLVDYNLMDCELAYKILEEADFIGLAVERAQLTGMTLDKIGSSIASFDSLYIRKARKKGYVSPTLHFSKKQERIKGGFVMSPVPGIYQNVLVFDFKSLYPSIIKTFNIDPLSFLEKREKDCIEAPNKACFKNQEGILPEMIEELHQAREKAKREKRELSSYAIKIIMNSFFGVLASPNCRYFSLDMANAITNFGQEIIKLTARKINEKGFEVIYGDTDSVFVKSSLKEKDALKAGEEIQQEINRFYEDYVKKNYNRKSYLDLEFEKMYLSLMFPKVRDSTSKTGAKKRYAGLLKSSEGEKIEVVGLEAIRGDWTEAAQEFQKELLKRVFKEKDASKFIKNFVKSLQEGKLDEKLVYRKSIRKDLKDYTKTTPPHVKAARKLKKMEGNVIQYYVTTDGPEPIQDKKHKIDYKHYIDKQIKPIAEQILGLLGKNFDDVLDGSKQERLF